MKFKLLYISIFILSACSNIDTKKNTIEVESTDSTNNYAYTCGYKKLCTEMKTCEEAKYYHEACNINNLDRDSDGIPCESLCL